MSGGSEQIDVVIVPDFCGPKRTVFEVRTLFFLASWLELGERVGRRFQPFVCAIGEPPATVRRMAERAGATVSVHAPLLLDYGGFANKMRGLEAPGNGVRRLLLDADMMVLGNLDALAGLDADLAATTAGKPQVPEEQWRIIYEGLGLPVPTERMASVHGERGMPLDRVEHRYDGQEAEAASMLPYYNSGALLVRRGVNLRPAWEDCLRRIPGLFRGPGRPAPAHALTTNDQAGLAVAIQVLRRRGHSFAFLPHAYNVRLVHFRTGAVRFDDVKLLHAAGFGGYVERRADVGPALENYAGRWCEAIEEGLRDRPQERAADTAKARRFLKVLWERWVREYWEAGED